MLTPIEQTPSAAYDASRQLIMPAVPVEPPAPLRLEDTPIKPADSSDNQYDEANAQGRGDGGSADQGRQQAVVASALRTVYRLLQQLKDDADDAKATKDTGRARHVANEAADLSLEIHRLSRTIPVGQFVSALGTVSAALALGGVLPPSVAALAFSALATPSPEISALPSDPPVDASSASGTDGSTSSADGTASGTDGSTSSSSPSASGTDGSAFSPTPSASGTDGSASSSSPSATGTDRAASSSVSPTDGPDGTAFYPTPSADGTIPTAPAYFTLAESSHRVTSPYKTSITSNTEAPSTGEDVTTPLDLARTGLGTAKNVVDTAASVPQLGFDDSRAISHARSRVLEAMSGVESLASQAADLNGSHGEVVNGQSQLDINA